ncbi:Endonuclease/exonuclease/phosphatase [Niveomyces insectorum RCEF 264]|uniref:Endonuclease/exonuclease/phosphatase n=1 Tax=Niveomyces insectorum RCEF 264 TaxID=1081102 RepID=A0A167YY31_9HYPO|nr:Endonuclease/exonuclease/phosphatase [Niveomyces insectorum RCEF 264]
MDPSEENGPDGSSIKPVSSLRARFENMSKPSDAFSPHPSPLPFVPGSRPISPAPKPDKFREQPPTPGTAGSSHHNKPPPPPVAPATAPASKPRPRDPVSTFASSSQVSLASSGATTANADSHTAAAATSTTSTTATAVTTTSITPSSNTTSSHVGHSPALRPSNRLGPPPPLSPRPIPPPSLLVQPPHSPPKGRVGNTVASLGGVDASSYFLNPDAVAKAPLTPSASPRLPTVPSRPHTPTFAATLDMRRSPRLSPSQPPSPPPPRRSAELKRERDQKEQQPPPQQQREFRAAPPPVNRAEKPKIPSQHLAHSPGGGGGAGASPVSPFLGAGESGYSPPGGLRSSLAEKRASYTNSPYSSADNLLIHDHHDELPPSLPARPRPPQQQQLPPQLDRTMSVPPLPSSSRPKLTPSAFEPPPVHHAVVTQRSLEREQKMAGNGAATPRGLLSPQTTGADEARPPPLPTRPHGNVAADNNTVQPPQSQPQPPPPPPPPVRNQIPATTTAISTTVITTTRPPPHPPRPNAGVLNGASNSSSSSNSNGHSTTAGNGNTVGTSPGYQIPSMSTKRVVSNPTTTTISQQQQQQQQFPPPPMRTQHVRSMTVDRVSNKIPNDFRKSMVLPTIGAGSGFASSGTSTPTEGSGFRGATGAGLGAGSTGSGNGSAATSTTDTTSESALSSSTTKAAATDSKAALVFPDASNINRRPPYAKQGVPEITTRYETRHMDVCGQRLVTTGTFTRVWSLQDGDILMSLSHGESIKATAVVFKPGAHADDEGMRVWIGNSAGELMEADIATQSLVASRPNAHNRHEIVRLYRHFNELWSLCDGGALYVWGPVDDGAGAAVPSLAGNQHQSFRVPRGHTFSMVVGDELWYATGKELRVFLPTLDGKAPFQVLMRALCQENAGDISAGTVLLSDLDTVYFGHTDGKVSLYSRTDYTCVGLVSLGSYKINSLASAGGYVWAGYTTGRVCVYDTRGTPWVVKKEWAAHDSNPVVKLLADRAGAYELDQLRVVSLGADNVLRLWDGFLQDDWLEAALQSRDTAYCDFDTVRVQVLTWNAGAATPGSLRYAEDDARFMQDLLQAGGGGSSGGSGGPHPDILVFGFQELVDLEDKTATAKRILKPKKRSEGAGADGQEKRMSHQYRDWRDFLVRCLDDFMDGELYHLLQTAHMVGLFTCVFVKADLRDRIGQLATAEVKRGMGGLHGNKGAVVVRFLVDDTSLCFVNCHLAAGQSQAAHRHQDLAAILDTAALPAERDVPARLDRPAWCDRLLYRGGPAQRVQQLDYVRHEVRVSDHRPVTGRFAFTVKRVDPARRAAAWAACQQGLEAHKAALVREENMYYLTSIVGYDAPTTQTLIRDRAARRTTTMKATTRSPAHYGE